MIITKRVLQVLKYIYKRKTVSYSSLRKKFRITLVETLEDLVYHNYLIQVGGSRTNTGEPIKIIENTLFQLDDLGYAEVEGKQWFNSQFVMTQILLPIVIAIITTLLTLFLSALL